MQVRTFTVPFPKIVGDEAHELEFGPDDYVVVRPLFGLSQTEVESWADRIREVEALADAAVDDATQRAKAEDAADQLVLDLLNRAVVKWSLTGPEGPIEKPGTTDALNALPSAVMRGLFPFLTKYRGEGPNPTTRG